MPNRWNKHAFKWADKFVWNHKGHKAIEYRAKGGDFFIVAGHMPGTIKEWSDAMGIDWMTKYELSQAVPPAYSEYLVRQIFNDK